MTKRDLAFVACKILGLYFFAGMLTSSVQTLFTFLVMLNRAFQHRHQDEFRYSMLYSLVPCAVHLIVGCFLWFAAGRIARRIAPEESQSVSEGLIEK